MDPHHGRFAAALAAYLRSEHGASVEHLDESMLLLRVRVAIARALRRGCKSHDAVQTFVILMFALEPNFDRRSRVRRHFHDSGGMSREDAILSLVSAHPNCWYRADSVVAETDWERLVSQPDAFVHCEVDLPSNITNVSLPQLSPEYGFQLDVPYVETPQESVHAMLNLARVGPSDVVLDLGCGDGRVVLAAVERGARGIGVDLNPEHIERAKSAAVRAGVVDRVTFLRSDFHDVDVSQATVVTLYLLRHVNLELRDRLRSQLRPGARIVSRQFDMGDWEPHAQIATGAEKIYCWRI